MKKVNDKKGRLRVVLIAGLLSVSSGAKSQHASEEDIKNPHSDYSRLLETVIRNKESIKGGRFMVDSEYCLNVVDEVAEDSYRPIHPSYRADSLDDLTSYVREEYQCDSFSLEDITVVAGSRTLSFVQEPPFYVYHLEHLEQSYFSVFGSGVTNSGAPKTPELDFEGNPVFMIYEGDSCGYANKAHSYSMIGSETFAGFLYDREKNVVGYNISQVGDRYISLNLNTVISEPKTSCAANVEKEAEQ